MKHLILLGLVLFASIAKSAEPETIVKWHTLKVTSNYERDLEATKPDEYIFVWVDSVNYDFFELLKDKKQSYSDSLSGVRSSLVIGKGKYLQEIVPLADLKSPDTQKRLIQTYLAPSEPKKLKIEGMHKHQCGKCGTVWAHAVGGSHNCPSCGSGPWLYHYQGPKEASFIH